MSIASELTALAANKAAIKAAIEAKNPSTMPTDALSQWPTSIASIGGGGHEGWIYGYVIDESDSNPATRVTYIEDNADFDPLYMDFANDALVWGDWQDFVEEYFRPAMLKSDGTIDYYLDPNNLTNKADGVTASDVANTSYNGNAMLIVKPIFYNISRISGSKIAVRFSNIKQGIDWVNWTHLKSDGTYADFCGWPLFAGSIVSSKLRSMSTNALPSYGQGFPAYYDAAIANGSNWYTTTWADEMMIRLLFPLLCKSTDSQGVIGGGGAGRSAPYLKCGQLSGRGYFWGKSDVSTSTPYGSKFLGMENVWGELWRAYCGLFFAAGSYFRVKLTPSRIDGSKCDTFYSSPSYSEDYIALPIESGYPSVSGGRTIKTLRGDQFLATLPWEFLSPSDMTKYYCDTTYVNNSAGTMIPVVGGSCAQGASAGVYATDVSLAYNTTYWTYAASLSYHFY